MRLSLFGLPAGKKTPILALMLVLLAAGNAQNASLDSPELL